MSTFDQRPWRFTQVLWIVAVFFLVGCALYLPRMPHTFVTLNDPQLVSQNPIVQQITPANVGAAFTHFDPELYIPFTFLSYQLDWLVGGGSAYEMHVTNLVLHILDALLVCWLCTLLSRRKWIGLFCGLVFLVHPINAETVLWISARKDLLSTFFGRSALVMYLLYVQRSKRGFLVASVLFFLCALLAKVKVVLLPISLLLVDWKEHRSLRATFSSEKLPYLCLSVLFGVVALFGKQEVIASSSLSTKIFLSVKSGVLYLSHFFVPQGFSIYYPYLGTPTLLSLDFLVPLLLLSTFIIAGLYSLRWTREIAFGCALYLIGLVPSFSNLAKGMDLFLGSDRYAYSGLMGISYAIAALAVLVWTKAPVAVRQPLRRGFAFVSVVAFCALGFLAVHQEPVWADSISLYQNAIAQAPGFYQPYYDLGVALDEQGRTDEAMTAYRQSLALKPDNPLAHVNMGLNYYLQGMRKDARDQFAQALKAQPHFALASFNVAVMDAEDGHYQQARMEYQQAIADDPGSMDARLNLAAMDADHGNVEEALKGLSDAITLDPHSDRVRSLEALFQERGMLRAPSAS